MPGFGAHRIWWVGGRYASVSVHFEGFSDHVLAIVDVSNPAKPVLAGRWWLPGMNRAGGETAPTSFGKRTALPEYPTKGRGTGGVITIKLRPKDEIASAQVVYETSLLTFITTGGTVMRCQVSDISLLGRSTQGVTILNVGKNDRLAALSVEEPEDEGGGTAARPVPWGLSCHEFRPRPSRRGARLLDLSAE